MWRLNVDNLFGIVEDLSKSERGWHDLSDKAGVNTYLDKNQKETLGAAVSAIQIKCSDIHFPVTIEAIRDTLSRLHGTGSMTFLDCKQHITAIKDILRYEARAQIILHLDQSKKDFFSGTNIFGQAVDDKFHASSHNIAEAGKCFALHRWDACVHHLVIAVEIAMRKWARSIGVKTKKHPLDYADMEHILAEARKKLEILENSTRGKRREKAIQYLTETIIHFACIKSGYRLSSAHGRIVHTEETATKVMNHVRDFMKILATKQ
jgi:hypothetical protein